MTRLFIELTPVYPDDAKPMVVYSRAITALQAFVARDGDVINTHVYLHDESFAVRESIAQILGAMNVVDDVQIATMNHQPQAPAPKPDAFEDIVADMDNALIDQDEAEMRFAAYFAAKQEQTNA